MFVPPFNHIVVVMMENHGYNQIIGNTSQAPYINHLAKGGALLSNYNAVTHPSEPNYLALYAGSTFGITDDGRYHEPDPTLATVLQDTGRSFIGYVEHPDAKYGHNPWESFPEGHSVERSFADFPKGDFASLPTVAFVIPNLDDDMHDGTIRQGDTWLRVNLGAYARWARLNNSLLIVAWDESDGGSSNRVPVILEGAHVKQGVFDQPYNDYSVLHTILAAYGLPAPRHASSALAIQIFTQSRSSG